MECFHGNGLSLIEPKIWPPNSPDLSPLDYFFWNEVKTRLKKKLIKIDKN